MSDLLSEVERLLMNDEPDYETAVGYGARVLPGLRRWVRAPNAELASKAASLAGMLDQASAMEVLEVAVRHPEALVRIAAAGALKGVGGRGAGVLLERLMRDRDAGVRRVAVRSAAGRGHPALRRRLVALSEGDPSPSVRKLAENELGEWSEEIV